jgi:hypothetical protein
LDIIFIFDSSCLNNNVRMAATIVGGQPVSLSMHRQPPAPLIPGAAVLVLSGARAALQGRKKTRRTAGLWNQTATGALMPGCGS